jgi:hypothetical protein
VEILSLVNFLIDKNYSFLQYASHQYMFVFLIDASGNPVTQVVISVTDASGNSVTGKILV